MHAEPIAQHKKKQADAHAKQPPEMILFIDRTNKISIENKSKGEKNQEAKRLEQERQAEIQRQQKLEQQQAERANRKASQD